jgi:hypothetical protein
VALAVRVRGEVCAGWRADPVAPDEQQGEGVTASSHEFAPGERLWTPGVIVGVSRYRLTYN